MVRHDTIAQQPYRDPLPRFLQDVLERLVVGWLPEDPLTGHRPIQCVEHDSACGDSLASWHDPVRSDNRSNVNEKDTRPLFRAFSARLSFQPLSDVLTCPTVMTGRARTYVVA